MQDLRMPTPESEYLPTPMLNVSLAPMDASSDSLSNFLSGKERTVQMMFVDHVSGSDNLAHRVRALAQWRL
jgi:hypothetical protein